jgi:hypothetical protein
VTPTLEALCRRWMACEDFVWERGMITASGWIVVSVGLDDLVLTRNGYDVRHETQESLSGAEIPDLSHAGTAGWLLEQMRLAVRDPEARPWNMDGHDGYQWVVWDDQHELEIGAGSSELEASISALERCSGSES